MSLGYFGSTVVDELNRLANGGIYPPRSSYLDTAGAAQAWAASVGVSTGDVTDVVGILNILADNVGRSNWLDIAGVCNQLAATTGLEPAAALRTID